MKFFFSHNVKGSDLRPSSSKVIFPHLPGQIIRKKLQKRRKKNFFFSNFLFQKDESSPSLNLSNFYFHHFFARIIILNILTVSHPLFALLFGWKKKIKIQKMVELFDLREGSICGLHTNCCNGRQRDARHSAIV